ncbi:MAG: hypothetical protein P4L56_06685 [Candidatus Sulfopaludibacter sp.]|nr:hypothetical protein [Candidatus Sulfopaludibacter sp.]
MAKNDKDLRKAQTEIRDFMRNVFASACEENATQCREDGFIRKAKIWDAVAKGLRDDVRKARVAESDNYAQKLFGTPTGNLSKFSFGKRSYDDNGLDSPPTKALDGPPMGKSSRGRNYNDSGL